MRRSLDMLKREFGDTVGGEGEDALATAGKLPALL
jgi:hypothetical protein